RSQVSAATVGVLDSEHQVRQENLEESRIRIGWLRRKLLLADAGTVFTRADMDQITARIESESQQLDRELAEAQVSLTNAFRALGLAREELRKTESRPDRTTSETAEAVERVATHEAQLETAQAALRTLRLMVESENVERAMWE